MQEYKGGFYMGRVECPEDYPAHAPKILLLTENGRFTLQKDGIFLSISHMHPEQWNPAWRVSQIVTGLVQFWLGGEGTYGSIYSNRDYGDELLTLKQRRINFAMKSREAVLNHPKFKEIFSEFADAMGITKEQKFDHWEPMTEVLAKYEIAKVKRDEERRKRDEERAAARKLEQEKRQKAEAEKRRLEHKKIVKEYFMKL